MGDSIFKEPEVTATMKCPSCGQILAYGFRVCKYCGSPIDQEAALRSVIDSTRITQACSLANSILAMRPGVIAIAVGSAVLCFFGYGGIVVIASLIICAAIVLWRWKYGSLQLPDDDFTEAQRMMKRELYIWLGLVCAAGLMEGLMEVVRGF
jgi:hypothetical protein